MKSKISKDHPLRLFLVDALHETLADKLMRLEDGDVEAYMTDLMLRFTHQDMVHRLRDVKGHRLMYVYDMLPEADIRLDAESFEREREVYQHIGDYVLFHAGILPEIFGVDDYHCRLKDHVRLAKYSYQIVSTHRYGEHRNQATTFKKLSEHFETYVTALRLLRSSFSGFQSDGWMREEAA